MSEVLNVREREVLSHLRSHGTYTPYPNLRAAEIIDRLASRVTTLEQERDAAVAGCAAWAAHNAIPSYQILDQHHTHFLGFKCKCCGGMGMKREAIAHAKDCNAKMGRPLLDRLTAAERVATAACDWLDNMQHGFDPTDEGFSIPREQDENALADAVTAYKSAALSAHREPDKGAE